MAADLDSLITSEIPEGRQNLLDSHSNLERVAEYCETNYFQSENKRAALEETKSYTTQSLASVAYQINTLAYNFLQMLDLQSSQIQEMESQINHISQTVSIHKEKVARREIGVLTTNKCSNRQYKIIAPANPERPIKYVRKPIDYACLDDIGHGVKLPQQTPPRQIHKRPSAAAESPYRPGNQYSGQYGPGRSQYGSIGNVSQNSAGPAPTTKPPTPPQNRFPSGTLTRNKGEYRTPPVVAPPQVPSNYAPNYPKAARGQQYGTLPHQHPQVGMVYPQQHEGGGTMPRLSSHSMRSTHSGTPTPPPQEGTYGVTRKPSTSSGDMDHTDGYGIMRQTSQVSSVSRQSSLHNPVYGQYGGGGHTNQPQSQYGKLERGATPPSQYGRADRGSTPPSQYGMSRPSGRPPSPPPMTAAMLASAVAPAPPSNPPPGNPIYARQSSEKIYSAEMLRRQQSDSGSVYSTRSQISEQMYSSRGQLQQPGGNYSRQSSTNSVGSNQPQQHQIQQQQIQQQLQKQLQQQIATPPPPAAKPPVQVQDISIPAWVPKNYLEKVLAIYDYNADKEDELTFQEGQTIYVLKKNDDGWWEGIMGGITGLFPGNYVEQTL